MTVITNPPCTMASPPLVALSGAQIRILEIFPGSTSEPITGRYHTVDLADSADDIHYEVLFYAEEEDFSRYVSVETVFVDNRAVLVLPTLYAALLQLRPASGESRYFWVDALCADHHLLPTADLLLNTQTITVDEIFLNSDHCAFWAGTLPPDVTPADAQAAFDVFASVAGAHYKPHAAARLPSTHAALWALLCSPVLRRILTDDLEACLPGVATLYWGPCRLPWEWVERALKTLTSEGGFGVELGLPSDGLGRSGDGFVDGLNGSFQGLELSH